MVLPLPLLLGGTALGGAIGGALFGGKKEETVITTQETFAPQITTSEVFAPVSTLTFAPTTVSERTLTFAPSQIITISSPGADVRGSVVTTKKELTVSPDVSPVVSPIISPQIAPSQEVSPEASARGGGTDFVQIAFIAGLAFVASEIIKGR